MIKTVFLALITLALSLAVYLYFYLGFYKPVEVSIAKRGPFNMLFKDHTGAYHLIGASISEVETWAREHGVACERTFGEYLDDPSAVDQDRLRSRAGCILSSPFTGQSPYQSETRDETDYVVAQFSGSPSIGPFRVYPRAQKFIEEQRLKVATPVIEIYRVHGSDVETEFLFRIERRAPAN